MLASVIKCTFLASLVLWPVSCWQADVLPDGLELLDDLGEAPEQRPSKHEPFDVEQGGVRYRVTPQFDYRLHGLVVSRRAHDGDRMIHRRWNDHLNVADVCVVWGETARIDLQAFDFWNGQFTCFFRTDDDSAWRAFQPNELANNHLLSDDDHLRERIAGVEVGDQIRLVGYLASYANGNGFERGTSVVRTDTGNGACETIYVTDFDLLRPSPSVWQKLDGLAGWSLLGSVLAWLVGALRGWL